MTLYNDAKLRNLSHKQITSIQTMLGKLGYGCIATGTWDYSTDMALRKFQREMNLIEDGIPNRDIYKLLRTKTLYL